MAGIPVRRTIDSLKTLYQVERFTDIFVEGVTDSIIVEEFLENKGLSCQVIICDDVDFSDFSGIGGNRGRLAHLAKIFEAADLASPIVVVDRDLHDYSSAERVSGSVVITEFTSLDISNLSLKYLASCFRSETKKSAHKRDIRHIIEVSRFLMAIRLKNQSISASMPDLKEKYFNGGSSNVSFDIKKYLSAIDAINKSPGLWTSFEGDIRAMAASLPADHRKSVIIHDLSSAFRVVMSFSDAAFGRRDGLLERLALLTFSHADGFSAEEFEQILRRTTNDAKQDATA